MSHKHGSDVTITLSRDRPFRAWDIDRFGADIITNRGYNLALTTYDKKVKSDVTIYLGGSPPDPEPKEGVTVIVNTNELPCDASIPIRIKNKVECLFKKKDRADYIFSTYPHEGTIPINAFDYDQYLKTKKIPPHNQWVFIDQLLGIDVGDDDEGMRNRDQYCNSMKKFMEPMEPVIISGHPRGTETHTMGKPIVYNKTNELVAGSCGVINHFSTTVNLIVLHRKPIIMVKTPEFTRSMLSYMRGISDILSVPIHSSTDIISEIPSVDENKYHNYEQRYIHPPGAPKKKNIDIILDYVGY